MHQVRPRRLARPIPADPGALLARLSGHGRSPGMGSRAGLSLPAAVSCPAGCPANTQRIRACAWPAPWHQDARAWHMRAEDIALAAHARRAVHRLFCMHSRVAHAVTIRYYIRAVRLGLCCGVGYTSQHTRVRRLVPYCRYALVIWLYMLISGGSGDVPRVRSRSPFTSVRFGRVARAAKGKSCNGQMACTNLTI